MSQKGGVTVSRVTEEKIRKGLHKLDSSDILIGIAKGAGSHKVGGKSGRTIDNADLAYLHEKGSTDTHLPPRPFLSGGVQYQKKIIRRGFELAARAAIKGDLNESHLRLDQLAQAVADGVRTYTQDVAEFPPIKPESLIARAELRGTGMAPVEKKVAKLLAEGNRKKAEEITAAQRPLINTGDLIKSVRGYVFKRMG